MRENNSKKKLFLNIVREDRAKNDVYPTPKCAIDSLLNNESFEGNIWECASGEGHISKILIERGFKVLSTELREDRTVFGEKGIDFFKEDRKVDNIITNPPFCLAEDFVIHAIKCTNKKVAMLLRVGWLESKSRYKIFKSTPISKIYIFSNRLPFYRNGVWYPSGASFNHAWYIWDKDYKEGLPKIDWLIHTNEIK